MVSCKLVSRRNLLRILEYYRYHNGEGAEGSPIRRSGFAGGKTKEFEKKRDMFMPFS